MSYNAMRQRRSGPRLRVSVTDGRGRPLASQALGRWLRRAAPASARGGVAIAIVSDRAMRQMNRRYRGVDHATDVLSFPSGTDLRRPPPHLGDIAIASGVARRQARVHGHSLQTELRVLALHGLLHLLGYDHESDHGQMHRVEARLRRRAGLSRGLIERTPRRSAGAPR
jgi:probable rRNA maturation factor